MLRESMTTIEDSNEGAPRGSTNQLGYVNAELLFNSNCMNMAFDENDEYDDEYDDHEEDDEECNRKMENGLMNAVTSTKNGTTAAI